MDLQGQPGPTSQFLGDKHPHLKFQLQAFPRDMETFEPKGDPDHATVYVIKSVLWNLPDQRCISALRTLVPALGASPSSVILVNDLLSPPPGTFEPHVDKAYRRRDVTVMTMHNAKLRTEDEWLALLEQASPNLKVSEFGWMTPQNGVANDWNYVLDLRDQRIQLP